MLNEFGTFILLFIGCSTIVFLAIMTFLICQGTFTMEKLGFSEVKQPPRDKEKNVLFVHNLGKFTEAWPIVLAFGRNGCGVRHRTVNSSTPYWTSWGGRLPFFVPKGIPVSIFDQPEHFPSLAHLMEEANAGNFALVHDLIVEADSPGQYHLTGYKKTGIPTVLLSWDAHDPSKRAFQKWIQKDFTRVFITHKTYLPEFENHARWWPASCDSQDYRDYGYPKSIEVGFVGRVDNQTYRERMMLLTEIGNKHFLDSHNNHYGFYAGRFYNRCKIVFNKSVAGELNCRPFHGMACNSLVITDRLPKSEGLEELFEDGKHLVLYDGEKDMMDKIGYFLKHDKEREGIALNGHKEYLAKHTTDHRVQQIIQEVFGG